MCAQLLSIPGITFDPRSSRTTLVARAHQQPRMSHALTEPSTCSVSVIFCAERGDAHLLDSVIRDAVQEFDYHQSITTGFNYEVLVTTPLAEHKTPSAAGVRMVVHGEHDRSLAIRAAALQARGEALVVAPANGAVRPLELLKLADKVDTTWIQIDAPRLAVGSRQHFASSLERILCTLAYTLTGVPDPLCPARALNRVCARKLMLAPPRPAWWARRRMSEVELLVSARRRGVPLSSMRVRWTDVGGARAFALIDALVALVELIVIALMIA